jgi:parvulin-like peptidyl-prolyl isomerase
MPPEFEAVAFSQAPGSLSEIVKTKFGYHVFEVIEAVHKGQIAPYEDLKDFFGKFLREQNAKKVVDDHLQALVKNAKIEVLLD